MQHKHIAETANRVLIAGQIRPLESLETAGKQSVQPMVTWAKRPPNLFKAISQSNCLIEEVRQN